MSCMANIDPHNNYPQKKGGSQAPPPQQQPMLQNAQLNELNGIKTENMMLRSDLNEAINYIYSLGGKWPPPNSR